MSPRVRALPNANEQRLGCMLRIASWKQCPSFGLSQCAGTGHLEGSDQRLLSSVSSPNWSCCVLHEWPVFPPPGSAVDLALAAFSAQRENRIHRLGSHLPFAAFAHKISVEAGSDRRQCGLSGLLQVRRVLVQQLLALAAQNSLRCGAVPQTSRSIRKSGWNPNCHFAAPCPNAKDVDKA